MNFDDLNEEKLVEILDRGNLSEEEFAMLLAAMQAKGMQGSIMAVDDPNSEEGRTAKEYIDYHKNLPQTYPEISDKEIESAKKILRNPKASVEAVKKALIILAHIGRIDTLRSLEAYEKKVPAELKIWFNMAIDECKGFLESDLYGKPTISLTNISKIGRNDPCP